MKKPTREEVISTLIQSCEDDIRLLETRIGSTIAIKQIKGVKESIAYFNTLRKTSFSKGSIIAAGAIIELDNKEELLVYDFNLKLYGGFNPNVTKHLMSLCHLQFLKQNKVKKVGDSYKTTIGANDYIQNITVKITNIR